MKWRSKKKWSQAWVTNVARSWAESEKYMQWKWEEVLGDFRGIKQYMWTLKTTEMVMDIKIQLVSLVYYLFFLLN